MTLSDILNNPYVMPVIVAGVSALAAALGRLIVVTWRTVRGQLDASQIALVEALAATAVKWVEQTTVPGTSSAEKLDRAVAWLDAQLAARGIHADPDLLHAMVEAAVYGLTQPEPAP